MFFVRTAMGKDLPRVREILEETWHHTYDEIYGVERVNEIVDDWHSLEKLEKKLDQPNSEFLVADNGETVGGMAFASQTGKVIDLHQIYVHPDFHGGKTGLHLMIEIENSFLDAETIRLQVEEKNTRAIEFYKQFGFAITGETQNCGEPTSGIPALIMEKPVIYAED